MLFRLGFVVAALVLGMPTAAAGELVHVNNFTAELPEDWVDASETPELGILNASDKTASVQILAGRDLTTLVKAVTDRFRGALGPAQRASVFGKPGGVLYVSLPAEPTADKGAGFVAVADTCFGPAAVTGFVEPGGSVDRLKQARTLFDSLNVGEGNVFAHAKDLSKLPNGALAAAHNLAWAVCRNDIAAVVSRVDKKLGLQVQVDKRPVRLPPAVLADEIAVAGSVETYFHARRGAPWTLSKIDEAHFTIARGSSDYYAGFERVADTGTWVLDKIGTHLAPPPDAPVAPVVTRVKMWNGHYTVELPAGWKEVKTAPTSTRLQSDDGTASLTFVTGSADFVDASLERMSDLGFGRRQVRPVLGVNPGVLYLSDNAQPTLDQAAGLIAAARTCVGPTTVVGLIKRGAPAERARQARAIVVSLQVGELTDVFLRAGEIDKLPASARAAANALALAVCANDGRAITRFLHPTRPFTVTDARAAQPERVSASELRVELKRTPHVSLVRHVSLDDDGPWDVRVIDPERAFELVRGYGARGNTLVGRRYLMFERIDNTWMLVGATWKHR